MGVAQLLADTTQTDMGAGSSSAVIIIALVLVAISIVSFWKVFTKAGQPGWASIIPIYNIYILLKIVNRPAWWILLYLIPVVNVITQIVVAIDSAKAFGKSTAFGVIGLWFFSLIGYIIIGFGDAEYKGAPQR